MQYIRLARELEGVYTDLQWLVVTAQQLVRALYTPVAATAPEVEMVACFRDCTPMEHDAPVWFTECEYDFEEWVHCGIEEDMAVACDAQRPTAPPPTSRSLGEVCALPRLHGDTSPPLSGSTLGRSQGEEPERVPKNTSGGSWGPALELVPAST